jgi:predicted DNA-binding protein (UPF0251 family)
MPRRWRRRRGQRGRHPKPITLEKPLSLHHFTPSPHGGKAPISIEPPELEALRLVDMMGFSQEAAGEKMGVSRGTVWRLLQSARAKTVQALIEARSLIMNQ